MRSTLWPVTSRAAAKALSTSPIYLFTLLTMSQHTRTTLPSSRWPNCIISLFDIFWIDFQLFNSSCSWIHRLSFRIQPIWSGWSCRKIQRDCKIASTSSIMLRYWILRIDFIRYQLMPIDFINFQAKGVYPFTAPQPTSVADNWFCQKNNANTTSPISTRDICSYYTFSDSFMCKVTENQLKINNDRGTPLVCNDKLVGLLSVIIPPNSKNTTDPTQSACDDNLKTSAYYVRVAQYNGWIHSVIGVNLPATIDGQPQPVIPSSPPFHGTISEWK